MQNRILAMAMSMLPASLPWIPKTGTLAELTRFTQDRNNSRTKMPHGKTFIKSVAMAARPPIKHWMDKRGSGIRGLFS